MSSLLSCQDLGMNFGARMLFENITLHVNKGEKIGLIGPNGAGKSTLMKILAGIETPTSGARSVRRQTKLGYLPQNDVLEPEQSALDIVVAGLADSPLDAHDRQTRATITLGRVGFEDLEQKAGAMSGGWRKRLAIARELAREPDVLLLDEPTNHLDLDGIIWLEEFLSNADFDFIVCSHDRYLLDRACTRVVELNRAYPSGSFSVDGDYQFFLEKRAEFLEGQLRQQQALASKVRREVEWLRRGPKARTHKAKFRMDDAGRLQQSLADVSERNSQQKKLAIDFTGTDRRANKLLAIKGVSKTLGGKKLFEDLSFILEPGAKLGLLGVNGSGKSTLLKILLQQIPPDEGQVLRADGVRVAVFDQNRQQLDQNESLRRSLAPTGDNVAFQGRQMHIEAWAKMFLFRSEQLDMPVGSLSGGEQARILIARLMNTPADLLLLDEPTNDLDIPSLEVLENSLIEFPGAVILVTHDRFLLERVSTAILGLDTDGVTGFYQDYEDWNEARREREQARAKAKPAPTPPKPAKPAPAKAKKLTYAEQKEREQMEEKIMTAEEAVQTIEAELAQPGVSGDHRKLADCCQRLEEAQAEVQRLYSRWEELEKKA